MNNPTLVLNTFLHINSLMSFCLTTIHMLLSQRVQEVSANAFRRCCLISFAMRVALSVLDNVYVTDSSHLEARCVSPPA